MTLYGEGDLWVPVTPSVAALEQQPARHPQVTLRVIDNADHAMMTGVDPKQQMDPILAANDAPDSPGYFMTMAAWLQAHGLLARS